MSDWAHPGVKCICIAKVGQWVADGNPMACGPVFGRTYTIVGVTADDEAVWLRLRGWGDDWFDAALFRPKRELSMDVALFAHHLDQVGETA